MGAAAGYPLPRLDLDRDPHARPDRDPRRPRWPAPRRRPASRSCSATRPTRLLQHVSARRSTRRSLHLPGPDFVDRVVAVTDRSDQVLRNLQWLFDTGRLAGTGYVSILPVDQGIEHSGGASFAPNPMYFDPENIVRARDRGRLQRRSRRRSACSARSAGKLGAQDPVHRQAQPQRAADVPQRRTTRSCSRRSQRAWELGAAGVGATIYFGSEESDRQIVEVARAFEEAHRLGMFTVLWCYLRNSASRSTASTTTLAADLTGQANHLGVTIEADIIKQKLPENNGGYSALERSTGRYGKTNKLVYEQAHDRQPDRPHPLPGRQLLHGPRAADQQRRRVVGRDRPGRGRAHRGHQQARRRHRPDLRPQGVPAPDRARASRCCTRSRTSTSRDEVTIA